MAKRRHSALNGWQVLGLFKVKKSDTRLSLFGSRLSRPAIPRLIRFLNSFLNFFSNQFLNPFFELQSIIRFAAAADLVGQAAAVELVGQGGTELIRFRLFSESIFRTYDFLASCLLRFSIFRIDCLIFASLIFRIDCLIYASVSVSFHALFLLLFFISVSASFPFAGYWCLI